MRKISIASGGTVEITVNFAGRILDGDKGGVVVAAVVGGTVLAELRAVDPQPQPARARGLYVREIVCVQGRARYRSRRPGFPPHFVLKHGVWHYGMETSGLRRVVLREDAKVFWIILTQRNRIENKIGRIDHIADDISISVAILI